MKLSITRLFDQLKKVGPGIMAIGFTIGTGSVTSMIVAGSKFGMGLLWVLFLSCLFSFVLIEAYGRFALVTGQTSLRAIREKLGLGTYLAGFIILGISFGQVNSLVGILGITSNAVFEVMILYFPQFSSSGWIPKLIGGIILFLFYWILIQGSYSRFEKILIVFVSLLGLSFIVGLFITPPLLSTVISGFVPQVPKVEGATMLLVAFVGTTMAAATFISRPLFIQGKGWDRSMLHQQRKDGLWAVIMIFLICASIMGVSAGSFKDSSDSITNVLDMFEILRPLAGDFAVVIFFAGLLSAGLSSIFPIMLITPIMIEDFQGKKMDTGSTQFRLITAGFAGIALFGVLQGGNPIEVQILSQVFNVFVLPLVIFSILLLINKKHLMGEHRAGIWLNIGLVIALIFSVLISYNGAAAIMNSL
ncbi:NRAMP family divalent metal transporter [Jiulongibacter sediminis]|uniref:NRAMP family divalent metal transporter n=1 Tax=Jiulongibacter sediminis TaxID=1605367 RepID=UPI0026F2423F|nr:divalent metal cation transporter [Jiulongibacter sediminis]